MSDFITDSVETVSEITAVPSTEDVQKELDRLRQSNQDKYTAVGREGRAISPASVMALRFETFLDTFLGDEDRTAFEVNFESRFNTQLNEVLAQIRQEKLTAGTNPQGLFVPGK